MVETADIIIVGGGIIGMSTAFQIARRSKMKVIVLDKGMGPGEGSTGASSAVCRYRYTHPEMVQLAKDGISAYQNWPEFLNYSTPLAEFHHDGVLWLANERSDRVETEVKRLEGLGVRASVLDDQDVQDKFPALNTCVKSPDFDTGAPHDCSGNGKHLLELDGGYVDPVDALQDLINVSRQSGVDVQFQSHVDGVTLQSGNTFEVSVKNGKRYSSGILVNAAGPWCNTILSELGIESPWPLVPTRIQVLHINRPAEIKGHIPVCVDAAAGIYFRGQNRAQQIIIGSVREEDEREAVQNPDELQTHFDDDFASNKLYALQHRLPALQIRGPVRGYSGLYTVNRADVHPIVGRTPIPGFYVANGFSGHGFKLAPAVGSLLAKEITGLSDDFDTEISHKFLAFDRTPIHLESRSVLA